VWCKISVYDRIVIMVVRDTSLSPTKGRAPLARLKYPTIKLTHIKDHCRKSNLITVLLERNNYGPVKLGYPI